MVVTAFGDAARLEEREIAVPVPGPGEVSIDVDFAAVGLLDVLVRRGDLPDLVQPPFVPGLEVTGRVRALGSGVSGVAVGDAVVSLSRPTGGGYAEVALASAGLCVPLRQSVVDPALAVATVPNVVTAIGALSLAARIVPGDTVLVLGAAGGLGSVFAGVARSLGAAHVVGVVSSASKAEVARTFGFGDVVLVDDLAQTAERFDIVVDPVGGDVRARSMDLLSPLGRLLAVGNASGSADIAIGSTSLWLSNAGIVGFNVGGLLMAQPHRAAQLADQALDLLKGGEITIPVEVLPLAQAADAHRRLESRAVAGKIVLQTAV